MHRYFPFRIDFEFYNQGFVKSLTSVLRCILRHCSVLVSTPHSSEFARLKFEAFYFAV
jgi:hypothetical protein